MEQLLDFEPKPAHGVWRLSGALAPQRRECPVQHHDQLVVGRYSSNFSGIYNPDGNTWELFPNVVLTPPWTDKYFVNLQYIGILSNDRFSAYAGGVFKGKDIFLLQFQYNFNLIRGRG